MTNIRYVPFWEDDFEADTLGMKPEHKWIYWKLCVAITRSDTGWIKDDDNWIAARVGITAARWRRSRAIIDPYLELKTTKDHGKQLSQYRARREHGVATVRILGNQKGGEAKAKKDSKKNHNGTGKPNENNTSTPSQPHGQPDGQPHGQLGGQPYGQPSSNITEQKVISIKEITSARATDELTEWILSKTRLTEKTMPIPMHLVKTWVKNYHIDDIKKAITRVVRQRSYDIDKIKGLSYFAPAINIEYEKRLATLEMVIDAKVRGMDDENWCNLVSMWVEGREWPENYGPAPDEKSNLIPKKITRKYSGAIAARNKPKAVVNGGDEGVDFDSE